MDAKVALAYCYDNGLNSRGTGMLTTRYMQSTKNLPAIFQKIVDGTAPAKFTTAHLKSLGFKSSNDYGVIGLLKDLGFLTPEGTPTQRYHDYRDKSRSKSVMADALRDAYGDLFHINEKPSSADKAAIEGKFKTTHNATDRVALEQGKTFFVLLGLADLGSTADKAPVKNDPNSTTKDPPPAEKKKEKFEHNGVPSIAGLRYNIEVHLPATKDVEVFNAIFKSLKEHLLED